MNRLLKDSNASAEDGNPAASNRGFAIYFAHDTPVICTASTMGEDGGRTPDAGRTLAIDETRAMGT
jgi:hypothetical protein